ncbi:hypothetical protein LWI28_014804 [Acer negundo]|uniref:Uncharacterized protein n=1 Tax=Acer negundo TaxID=4023 RepID=A0AAD5NJ77_ACENE|nr:hypothetical protein LWI28_014804 [Acer negundo]
MAALEVTNSEVGGLAVRLGCSEVMATVAANAVGWLSAAVAAQLVWTPVDVVSQRLMVCNVNDPNCRYVNGIDAYDDVSAVHTTVVLSLCSMTGNEFCFHLQLQVCLLAHLDNNNHTSSNAKLGIIVTHTKSKAVSHDNKQAILRLLMPSFDSPSELQESISQRRFSMIDVCNYRKVSDSLSGLILRIEESVFVLFWVFEALSRMKKWKKGKEDDDVSWHISNMTDMLRKVRAFCRTICVTYFTFFLLTSVLGVSSEEFPSLFDDSTAALEVIFISFPALCFLQTSLLGVSSDLAAALEMFFFLSPVGEIFRLLKLMLVSQNKPDHITLMNVIGACAEIASMEMGNQVHCYIMKTGHVLDVYVMDGLIDMYLKCGSLEIARELFDFMEDPNIVL